MKKCNNTFSLIRTNPKLTGNVKLIVDSNYSLFLESIDSVNELSQDRYKQFRINKKDTIDECIFKFFNNTTSSVVYANRYMDDNDIQLDNYNRQVDDIYLSGSSYISNIDYKEEFEYFAPLHIDKSLPNNFIIFRLDGTGNIDTNKDNFHSEIVDNLKVVKTFDLSKKTPIGEFLDNNYLNNLLTSSISTIPLEIDFRTTEFTKWNGIDYTKGGYTSKSLFLADYYQKEQSFFNFDKFLTEGYELNNVIYPHILNLSFLFDDTPATKDMLKLYSINRYLGFYIDEMNIVKRGSLYSPPILKPNIIIDNNNTFRDSVTNEYIYPFVKDWKSDKLYYVELNGEFLQVIQVTKNGIIFYKILSDKNIENLESLLNNNVFNIINDNELIFNTDYNTNTFDIPNFTQEADIYLIKIDNKYHRLKYENNSYIIHSDYSFSINNNILTYFVNQNDPKYTTRIDLSKINEIDSVSVVEIYKLNLTNIKDFDTDIVTTDWSNFEYDKKDEVIDTDEPKIYRKELKSNSLPKMYDTFIYNEESVNIPVSSEYLALSEIFEVKEENDTVLLSDIWRKNPNFVKWGYKNSISNNDTTYRINNCIIADDFNRTTNVFDSIPTRIERNLDYFYSINPDSSNYINHSLHITDYNNDYSINQLFKFDFQEYLNNNMDYFDYIFTKKDFFNNGLIIKNTKKYSIFNEGDDSFIPNSTLFRGIKFNIYSVNQVDTETNSNRIKTYSISPSNIFENYKFSILLSNNNNKVTDNNELSTINNNLEWSICYPWEVGKDYVIGDRVYFNGSLFICNTDVNTSSNTPYLPANDPITLPEWTNVNLPYIYNYDTTSYIDNDIVYMYNEYYIYNSIALNQVDFYNSDVTYAVASKVIYKGDIYRCVEDTENVLPSNTRFWEKVDNDLLFDDTNIWTVIPYFNSNNNYNTGDKVVYEDDLYSYLGINNIDTNPDVNITNWELLFTVKPNNTTIYDTDDIVFMNNHFYICISNVYENILDNGIDICINTVYKNILINIYINDNTYSDEYMRNINRDELYTTLFSKLTAKNFIDAINDMDDNYSFINPIRYIIVDDNNFTIYNKINTPYILECITPDELSILNNSLEIKSQSPNKNLYKVKNTLKENTINYISELNYYNNDDLGSIISNDKTDVTIVDNASGLSNINYLSIYRYSGDYIPIFKDIHLFESSFNNGNYKFDTTLTNFGLIEERLISKVNLKDNFLKLKDVRNVKSIYPMIDEYGYLFKPHFIFKSTWDTNFYIKIMN